MKLRRTGTSSVLVMSLLSGTVRSVAGQQAPAGTGTQIVMLGTGTPRADPDRSGPATAIVVGDAAYLVDFGPGVVRRAEAARRKGIKALDVTNLRTAFVTHLHSDHTVGYPDLIFSTWVQGRSGPLRVFGPAGLEAMTQHVMLAWQTDVDVRTTGLERRSKEGLTVEAHDVKPGVVYQDQQVKVTAFPVLHGELGDRNQSFGYRFDAADRSVVISGDASPSPALIDACQKCDVLIHEAYSERYRPAAVPNWLEYRPKYHTTTTQLAELANRTQPRLLVLYHRGVGGGQGQISDEEYLSEIRRTYRGRVVIARDLDVY